MISWRAMNTVDPLVDPVYRRLFAAQLVSLAGTGVTTIALALLAWHLAGDHAGEVLGTALALKMVVYVLLAPVLGAIAHKLPRKVWLVSLDVVRIGIVLCLPFVTAVWQVYVLIFLLNACAAGFTPAFQATIPDVIADEGSYQKALSYAQVAYSLEQVASPVLAGLLLMVMSYNGLFLLDALSFFASALLIVSVRIPTARHTDRSRSVLDNLRFGVVAYFRTPRLRAVWVMYFGVAAASAMVIVNTVVYVRDFLALSQSAVAWAAGASGVGSMVAAFAMPAILARRDIRKVMLWGTAVLGAALLLGASMFGFAMLLVVWAVLGAALSAVQTPMGSLVRRSCRPQDSTALFAANFSLTHFCWLIMYPVAGYVSTMMGLRDTFILLGLVACLAALIAWSIYPNPDPEEIEHTHVVMAHVHSGEHDELHPPLAGNKEEHRHEHVKHKHRYVIDVHHPRWAP